MQYQTAIHRPRDLDGRISNSNSSTHPSFTPIEAASHYYAPPEGYHRENQYMNPMIFSDSFDNSQQVQRSPDMRGPTGLLSPPKSVAGVNLGPKHVNPATMWLGTSIPAPNDMSLPHSQGREELNISREVVQQITPPDDDDLYDVHVKVESRYPSGSISKTTRTSIDSTASKKARVDGATVSSPDDMSYDREDKREKYREKNRVAAAKCRAKKKGHVDVLEDNHRTQGVLNNALKQTEQSLRDELSYWRTQALQHTFCDCHSIQEYNIRKARHLAQESFGKVVGPNAADSPGSFGMISQAPSLEDASSRSASDANSCSPVSPPSRKYSTSRPYMAGNVVGGS